MNARGGFYRIRIQGELDPSWSDRLGGMEIRLGGSGSPAITVLTGWLPDQSALTGVVNALVDLRYEVLSVDRIE